MDKNKIRLSVVIPAFNEQENVEALYDHLHHVLADQDFEVIFVDDGSTDNTLAKLQALAHKHSTIRVISFSRNFGKEVATSAGIMHANGDAVIMIDADGQFPLELVPKFIQRWQAGAQVVTGLRLTNQKEGFIKRYGSKLFYSLMNKLTGIEITPKATDFRLIDRVVAEEFKRFAEHDRLTRGLIDWMGFKQEFIPFHANKRATGETSYTVSKLFKLAVSSFVSLSLAPLYFSGYAGLVITPIAFLLGLFVFIEQLVLGDPLGLDVTGAAMLGILLLFFVGILLISQGLVALYISHIHTETKNRPLYIIDPSRSIRQ